MNIIPQNQYITINHEENKIFDYNNVNSRFYLGRQSNYFLRIFGDSLLIGLEVNDYGFIDGTNIIKFNITKGTVIIDSTLIEYNDDMEIEIDVTGTDFQNGKLVLSLNYVFHEVFNKNLSQLSCTYITNDGIVPDNSWIIERNNIILDVFDYDIQQKNITKITSPILQPKNITIKNKIYQIRPMSNIQKRILHLLGFTL